MKKWRVLGQDPGLSQKLSSELKISPLTAQVLVNRGINNAAEADRFLNPRLMNLKDPFDIPDMLKAAQRVLLAKERGEKVLVYGDYDVDGVTGTVILLETLKHLGFDPEYYIPSRYGEGYSLNRDAVKKIKDDGVSLIITDDCGISSVEEVEYARSLGLDVIVTDHHNLPDKLPDAYALVNPKIIKGEHESKYLSGAGVAFKFAWALLRTAGIKENGFITGLLDLACLGTVADVVPLAGENRVLAVCGLNLINERKRLGLKQMLEAASVNARVGVSQINYVIAPRINASGRLEHASISVKLLTSSDPLEAMELAKKINSINTRRQGIGENIQEEVFAKIEGKRNDKILIAEGENWHPGVIGIVASRVVDAFYRPTVLIGINEGVGRGSARSIGDFNIFNILNTCRDLFDDFGGHEGAAGFEIDPSKIEELKSRLLANIEGMITPDLLVPKIEIDYAIDPNQITLGLIKELDVLEPHGQGNPSPIFMTGGLTLTDIRKVGADGAHLKLKFTDGNSSIESIGFRMGKNGYDLAVNKKYDIAYNLETNVWNGFESAQLNLVDIRETSPLNGT
ncbi:MAG TPA: single-stranded-DNA-specific exonuclease RecJ [Candidatus Omnitrophota bacterium]|nr:single-stranded-DNA-specific exonuclease RecJ [Candidatus Omnitrophota bacterium]